MYLSTKEIELQMQKTDLWLPGSEAARKDKLGDWD